MIDNNYSIFVDGNIPFLQEVLKGCGQITVFNGRELNRELLIENNCKALFARTALKVNSDLLEGTNVEFAATATSGTDHFDLKYLDEKGIKFASALGSNANSVAEYVVYSLLAWSRTRNFNLKQKMIGIIGFGCVGKLVAKFAGQLGMKVLINDPPLKDSGFVFPDNVTYTDFDTIIKECDVITNHVPLTRTGIYSTYKLFTADKIDSIKTGALFVHASRGFVVDESELIKRVNNGDLTAVIDVWENEPSVDPLSVKSGMYSTPHVAGHSYHGKINGTVMAAKAFSLFSGKEIDLSLPLNELKTYKPINIEKYRDPEFIYNLLKVKRKIDDDSNKLKALADLPGEEFKNGFELMRKNYPNREESL